MNAPAGAEEQSAQLLRLTRYGSATAIDSPALFIAPVLTDNAATQRCLLSNYSPGPRAGKGVRWAKGERYGSM